MHVFGILVTTSLILVLRKLREMLYVNGDIYIKKIISSLYFYTSLHSADQGELCPTAKKIGKDLSVI